jgi:NitT/TauT family transport system permease protein
MTWAYRILAIAIVIAIWEVLFWSGRIPPAYLPSVPMVGTALLGLAKSGAALQAEILTLSRALAGFALALVLGLWLAIFGWVYRPVREALGPLVELLRPIPPAALVPITVFALGSNIKLYLFVVVFVAIWPIYLTASSALSGVSPILIQTGRSFGCSRWETLWQVALPQATPDILVSARISAAISFIAVVVAEMLAGRNGIGYLLFQRAFAVQTADVFGLVLLCGVNGMLFNQLVTVGSRFVAGWHLRMAEEVSR